ncbi:maltase A2 isoform X2 [Nilaparvata lugens]|uniref:maltase A2 isoform X2 n=1 Tax=Nilaparvata lugens TaxID=108931 RepID=UPI00193CFE5D|nr:maltase A2 isoform X2 [Nilaparvata lugens]
MYVLAAYERQLSPSSIDPDLCNSFPPLCTPAAPMGGADFSDVTGSNNVANDKVSGPLEMTSSLHNTLETRSNGMASSSSSSSALQDAAASASAQLLNPHHYHNLAGDVACQENGGIIKPVLCSLRKTPDYCFVSWNWPLIRKFCFWSVMSMMVACVCIIITYVTTLPTKCDPQRSWYQGSLIYQIFPASFKDSNNDGIGDLRGINSRLDYLKTLGVRAIRLNSVFPSEHFPEHFYNIENFTNIEKTLGTMEDFRGMVKNLHKNNISVILDLPLHPYFKTLDARHVSNLNPTETNRPNLNNAQPNLNPLQPNQTPDTVVDNINNGGVLDTSVRKQDKVRHVIVNNHILNGNLNKTDFQGLFNANTATVQPVTEDQGPSLVSQILEFWLKEGVDGFYFKGLEKFVNDEGFVGEIRSWHHILNRFSKIEAEKIMICSLKVVAAVENDGPLDVNPRLATVLTRFSLIDVYVEKADAIEDLVRYVQKGVVRSDPGFPWAMWTTGDTEVPRLASRLYQKNETLALLAVQMMLPGTPSLFYGDEIGLDNIDDHDGERSDLSHAHSLAPMKWTLTQQNEARQQFAKPLVLGWMPEARVHAPQASKRVLATLSALRESSPSIYMQANWKDRQLMTTNCFIRYHEDNFILLERRYPRRFTYVVIANLGTTYKSRDLSTIFYGGHVLADHNGRSGFFMKFADLHLAPGEFYIIRLDK